MIPNLERLFRILLFIALIGIIVLPSLQQSSHRPDNSTPNEIVRENQNPGTDDWIIPEASLGNALGQPDTQTPRVWVDDQDIKGYASQISINHGQSITFHVSTNQPSYDINVYRMGWYSGAGGRFITGVRGLAGNDYGIPAPDPVTGRIEANWPVAYTLNTASDWVSGVYLAKLIASNGKEGYIFFVVRDDSSTADILFQLTTTTYQAYNNWGGKSLYDFNSTGGRAHKVSYNRPFEQHAGAGYFFNGDYQMIRWLEREGYSVAYATNTDLHTNANLLDNHKVFLSNYHDEYWSWEMREHLQTARDNGVDLAFFTSNNIYWQIRFEPSSTGVPNRTQVCYKDASLDPVNPGPTTTVQWRDPPVNRPENELLGVMYHGNFGDEIVYDYVVTNSSHWIYNGTGLQNGDVISKVVGDEYDNVWNNGHTPPNLITLSNSPVAGGAISNAAIYQATSGAYVFDASTNDWAHKLAPTIEDFNHIPPDWRIEQMTRNILNMMIGAAPSSPPLSPAYLYDDTPTWIWVDNNSGSNVNYANTSPVYAGTRSIAFTATSGSSRLSLRSNEYIDTTPYDTLQIVMRGTAANQAYRIVLWDINEDELTDVNISDYGGPPPTGSWRVYEIPLQDLGATNKQVAFLWLRPLGGATPTVYIDEIAFTKKGVSVAAPTNLAISNTTPGQLNLTWADNATNETSYQVERTLDGFTWLEIASLPANSTSYSDSNVTCGLNHQYRIRAFRSTGSIYSNPSNYAAGSPFCANFIQSNEARIIREGSWIPISDILASGGNYLSANSQSSILTLLFSGSIVETVYLKGPGQGTFAIEIDGTVVRTVDTSDVVPGYFFKSTIDYLDTGNHIMRIYPVAGPVSIDAFFVNPPALPNPPVTPPTPIAPSGTTYTYTPTFQWAASPNAEWYYLSVEKVNGIVLKQWYAATSVCSGSNCTATPALHLASDLYAWRVMAANSSGAGPWSATTGFDIPHGVSVLELPTSTIITATPLYKWGAADGATWYHLLVKNASGTAVLDKWYEASSVCNASACQVQPTTPVSSTGTGNFNWWLQAYSPSYSLGIWNGPLAFTVTAPTQNTPNATVTSSNPDYTWNKLIGASWYQVYVTGPNGFFIDEIINGSVCGPSICSTPLAKLLPANGAYSWYLRAWSADGYSPWAPGKNFTLNATLPPMISKLSPLANTTEPDVDVTFSWNAHASATSYDLYLAGPNGWSAYHQWNATTYCTGGTCSVTIAVPANGSYTWYLRGLNGAGGPWGPNDAGGNYGAVTFTVNAPTVGLITKTSPINTMLTSGNVSFVWQSAAAATAYELYVTGPNGWYDYQTWNAATSCTTTCTVNILVPANGSYAWYLRGKNAVGSGPWGPNDAGGDYGAASFTVNAALPPLVVKQIPLQGATLNNNVVTLAWAQTANATSYEIYLGGPNAWSSYHEYIPDVNMTCAAGTCSTTLAVPYNGTYQWYMRARSAAGFGDWGPPPDYGLRTFTVTAPPPPANPTLQTPANGTVFNNTVTTLTFTWNAASNTTWYDLVLVNRITGVVISHTWVSAEAAGCAIGGTCTRALTVPSGSYRWAVLTWGPASTAAPVYTPGVTPTFTFDKLGL